MGQSHKTEKSFEEFSFELQTRCISILVQDHVMVWFTQLQDSFVSVDTTIHSVDNDVLVSCSGDTRITLEDAYETYLKLQNLV